MILIFASTADAHAVSFGAELPSALVITCRDLAQSAIRIEYPRFHESTLALAGKTIRPQDISGVLNLLPGVFPNEFPQYAPEDRAARAADFRVLLIFLQSSLACPVVNRPTPLNLTGSVPNPAAWFAAAAAAGIPIARLTASSEGKGLLGGRGPAITVTCLGGDLVVRSGTAADDYTLKLAKLCRLEYLRALYRKEDSGIRFLGADSYPDIRTGETRAALRDYLLRRAA